MGPETIGGLAALSIISLAVMFIAWLNSGSCKLGRHDWSNWEDSDAEDRNVLQRRRCKRCQKLQLQASGCEAGSHEWSAWSKPVQSKKINWDGTSYLWFQDRSCKRCNAYDSKYFSR